MTGFARAATKMRLAGAVASALAVSACSYAQVDQTFPTEARGMDPATFECCFDSEKFYPAPLVRLALEVGNELGPSASELFYGDYEDSEYPGTLTGKADAHAAILAPLRPLDILLVSNHSYQIGRLMPGRFSHSLIYLGTEAQLRAAGLWHLPSIAPYHDQIRAGQILLEAAWPDVHLIAPNKAFETDQVLAMRPTLSAAEKRRAFDLALAEMGKPYNFKLGIDPTGESYACTGLAYHAMPQLGFTVRQVYGQTVVMPDDVAAQAVRGDKLTPLVYVVGTEDGFIKRSQFALMVEIASYWGIPGQQDKP